MKQAQIKSPGILEFENVPELSAHQLKPNEVLLKIERIILNESDDAKDEGTNSMMSDFIAEQEKTIWMLNSWLG